MPIFMPVVFFSMLLLMQVASRAQLPAHTSPSSAPPVQTETWKHDGPVKEPPGNEPIALTEPVLTIRGVCPPSGKTAGDAAACATVVTRQQFEAMVAAAAPGSKINSSNRQTIAQMYAELLAYEAAATRDGIADSPEFQETLRLLRLRALHDFYRRSLEKQYGKPSQEEIHDYYRREISRFEEVKLRRIVLPKNNFAVQDKAAFEKKVLQVATGLRERAAQGEDMEQLQHEAFTVLGFSGQPPSTDSGNRRRSALIAEVSEDVFSLNPGQVSKVESEPYSFVIYKVEAKRTLPELSVQDEISRELAKQKLENALKAVTGSVQTDLNEKYFGVSTPQAQSAAPGSATSR